MEVLILRSCKQTGVKSGEVYTARRRAHSSKIELLERVPDGHDPSCLEYMSNVAVKIQGNWHKVVDNCYVKMETCELDSLNKGNNYE